MKREVNDDISSDPLFFVSDGPTRFRSPKRSRKRPPKVVPRFALGDRVRHRGIIPSEIGTIIQVFTNHRSVWYEIEMDSGERNRIAAQPHVERI